MSLECLGNENRTTMLPERKRMRIGVFSFLITILGWAPPPVPLHGPAFRNLDKAAGESPSMVQAALDYQCDACLESTEPRHQRLVVFILAGELRIASLHKPLGKLERHGDIVKDMLRRLDLQSPLANDDLFDQALLQAFQAKNALVRHQGYAPEQIVLGEDLEAEMHRRPASLREWQQLSNLEGELPTKNTGGASTFVDLTQPNAPVISGSAPSDLPEAVTTVPAAPSVEGPRPSEEEIPQPEQEMTPQVSISPEGLPAAPQEVEREPAGSVAPAVFPSADASSFESRSAPDPGDSLDATQIPVPDSEDGLQSEQVFLACQYLDSNAEDSLQTFMTLQASTEATGPLLAEDELPYVESPLCCSEHQAFCLEIPLKAKDMKRWSRENSPEQLATIAAASKRARAEVHLKDLTPAEVKLFDEAKQKEIQCWIQTSAIRAVLRQKLNPEQILKSRWILTWKSPEPGESHRRAKARLVVLGFQDPKLVDVMRDAPTLSKEGRALVLQTIASCKFQLGSFDIKTAFLRGKADASNPLAMEPPRELRQALGLQEEEVCQLLGNAYGRVDAPLLFYKELSKQLHELGFVRHPLEPCVFLLYTGQTLNGILGVHVDDGVCGGDDKFLKKIQALQAKLPFGSRKFQSFVFTGIHLEQFPDFSIRASQAEYVKNIQQIDIGRSRRLTPDNPVTESERSKLRGLVGSLQYAVTHTRPDMAAKLGEVQGQITQATVQSLLLANKILRETQENAKVCIYFLPIRPSDLTFVSFGD
ncbi:RE1, partial [Symbiodinium necroappetens]